jgi:exopolyphosphatase/guanosine-5'-triphosphate,3'-diphosphate pyrophosphatase
MRKAIIDLGTNTFNLLIGELSGKDLHIVHSEKIPVMLGMGGINEGRIAEDAFARAMNALKVFKEKSDLFDVSSIKGIATSAVRSAANGYELVERSFKEIGIEIIVIDGLAEADLIRKGVALSMSISKPSVIMDIGGGSTEFIHLDSDKVIGMESLNIGVSRIYQMLGKPENFNTDSINKIIEFLEIQSKGKLDYQADVLIGASGTFETFYEMIGSKRFVSEGSAIKLDLIKLDEVIDWSIKSSLDARNEHPWIVEMRKRMLPIGAIKVRWIMEKLNVKEVWISPYSLKEGAFVS